MTAQTQTQAQQTPDKRIALIISRCVNNPEKFRLIKKQSVLGRNVIMFPSAKIAEGEKRANAAYTATLKCAIYGELAFKERFSWEDENGSVDVFLHEATEFDGSGRHNKEKMVLLSLDEILSNDYVTPLTKEAAGYVQKSLSS